ncbi:MAG: hypothetical protein DRN49_04380, partial [Thaumarchaeota archaeon]
EMPEPETAPPVGEHQYVEGWEGDIVAPEIVNESATVRWVFVKWVIYGNETGGTWEYHSTTAHVVMNQNQTAVAYYKRQYLFSVDVPSSPDWIESFTPYIYDKTNDEYYPGSTEEWFDEYTLVQAGIKSPHDLWRSVPWIYGKHRNEIVLFVNWTGYGYYTIPGTDAWAWSNPINLTGPTTAVMEWKYVYRLYVKAGEDTQPPLTDPPSGAAGWYDECTDVNLTAPNPHPTWISSVARWRFDKWELDGTPVDPSELIWAPDTNGDGLADNVTLTVHMDSNHTAAVYYKRQSLVYLADNIGNQSGIADTGKWYDNCEYYTFSAPEYVYVSPDIRYEFRFWELDGKCFGSGQPTITLHINKTFDGKTLKARYQTQYRLILMSEPSDVFPMVVEWWDAGKVTDPKTAPEIVNITDVSRWHFVKWVRTVPPGWESTNPTIPYITMDQPKNFTAYYNLEWKREWYYSPDTITIPGWPSYDWQVNGTTLYWIAPPTDPTGQFVFYYWVIDGVEYPQGQNRVPITHDHYIVGTAYYANKTKMFMSPSRVEFEGHSYCEKFNVTVYAANFDSKRLVNGRAMDIYGFEIIIDFDPSLIQIQDVYKHLDEFFGGKDYMVYIEEVNNTAGYYKLVASVLGNYTGFEGTRPIFTLTFHVAYDPCYPDCAGTWIKFSYVRLVNHEDQVISPELGYHNCYYRIRSIKPIIELRDASDGDNTVIVHKNAPEPTYFDVEVWLLDGVKVQDFAVTISYDKDQLEAVDVTIGDYLKPPYTAIGWLVDKDAGIVMVYVEQDPSVPLQNCSGILFTITFKVVQTIFYRIPGPHHLTSKIKVEEAELSVYCPDPTTQSTTDNTIGTVDLDYVYNPLPGDLDADGQVTVLDLQLIVDTYGQPDYDITGDCKADIVDLVFVALRFGSKIE